MYNALRGIEHSESLLQYLNVAMGSFHTKWSKDFELWTEPSQNLVKIRHTVTIYKMKIMKISA